MHTKNNLYKGLHTHGHAYIDNFARCKHWSRSTSCFSLTLHKSWDKIQPTEHVKLNQKVKQIFKTFSLHVK